MIAMERITDSSGVTYPRTRFERTHLKPCADYIDIMIEIPKGYRPANDKDKKRPKPKGYMYLYDLRHGFEKVENIGSMNWNKDIIFVVPIETEVDRKRKETEDEIREAQARLDSAQAKLKELED